MISEDQMQEGERQALETLITIKLAACSCLDQMPDRRGKISRLDGQGAIGEISILDRIDTNDP